MYAHSLRRWLLFHTRRPRDRHYDQLGPCSLCGETARFLYNSWVLPSDVEKHLRDRRVIDAFRARESLWCERCGGSLRVRRLAEVLLLHFGQGVSSLQSLVHEPSFRDVDILELNSIGEAHPILAAHRRLTYVEYPQEDAQSLSYADDMFDLVLTSETFEHVPDVEAGWREMARVLRPGGMHVLTIPLIPGQRSHSRRGQADVYHGRPGGPFGILSRSRADMRVETEFGLDVVVEIERHGMDVHTHFYDDDYSLAGVICAVKLEDGQQRKNARGSS